MSELFNPIGEKVEQVAPVADSTINGENVAPTKEEDRKPVEEIVSLCMNCHKNVSGVLSLSGFPIEDC